MDDPKTAEAAGQTWPKYNPGEETVDKIVSA